MPGPRNRHDVVSLGQHPRQRELGGGAFVLLGDLFNSADQIQVLLKIFTLKAWVVLSEIFVWEIAEALDLARQESAAEWTIGDEADVERAECLEQTFFGVAAPERVLGLHGADRVHCVRTTDGSDRCL